MNKTMLTDDNLRQIKETHTNMLTVALAAELLAAREEVARVKEMEKGFYRMINGSLEREKAVEAERDELKASVDRIYRAAREEIDGLKGNCRAYSKTLQHGQEAIDDLTAERDRLREANRWVLTAERLPAKGDGDTFGRVVAAGPTGTWALEWWAIPESIATRWCKLPELPEDTDA